jgi:hypothetical protein
MDVFSKSPLYCPHPTLSRQGGGERKASSSPLPSPLPTGPGPDRGRGRQAPREKGVEGYHRGKLLAIISQFLDFLYRILGYNVPHGFCGEQIDWY